MRELVIAGQVSSIVWQSIKYQVLSGEAKTFGCRTEFEEVHNPEFFHQIVCIRRSVSSPIKECSAIKTGHSRELVKKRRQICYKNVCPA